MKLYCNIQTRLRFVISVFFPECKACILHSKIVTNLWSDNGRETNQDT